MGDNGNKRYLTAEEIFGIKDLQEEEVYVPEWDTYILLRALDGHGRDEFETEMIGRNGGINTAKLVGVRARLIQRCAIHAETGVPLFTTKQVNALNEKSPKVLDRLFEVCQRLSGLDSGSVEESEKNFESDQVEDSGTS